MDYVKVYKDQLRQLNAQRKETKNKFRQLKNENDDMER